MQRFCSEADAKSMLQCLKQNKNSELMDPKCKQMITKRQITQNTGIVYQTCAPSIVICIKKTSCSPRKIIQDVLSFFFLMDRLQTEPCAEEGL